MTAASGHVLVATAVRPPLRSALAATLVLTPLGLALPTRARAGDVEFTSDSSFQAYDVRSPNGQAVLVRRRFTTSIGVESFDLFGTVDAPRPLVNGGRERAEETGAPKAEYAFRARLRYDGDAGISEREINPGSPSNFLPNLFRSRFDFPYGYLEGRNLVGGRVGVRIGRMYQVDPLGFWNFDGAQVRVAPLRIPIALTALGGAEVRGGLALSSPRFEAEGAYRGDRSGLDPSVQPAYQQAALAPAAGLGLEGTFARHVHAALSWRKVWNTGVASTNLFERVDATGGTPIGNGISSGTTGTLVDGLRVSTERLGGTLGASFGDHGGGRAGVVWDVHFARVRSGYASLDWMPTTKATLSLDYDFVRPSYDGDSIWNFFAVSPTNDLGFRASFAPSRALSIALGSRLRAFGNDTTASPNPAFSQGGPATGYLPATARMYATGGNVGARYTYGSWRIGGRVDGSASPDASRIGTDVYVERLWDDRFITALRGSLWRWHDGLRADRDATSVGWVGSFGYRFDPRTQGRMEVEHNVNRLYGGRFRLLFVLTVAVSK
jgi:hypothetical protein